LLDGEDIGVTPEKRSIQTYVSTYAWNVYGSSLLWPYVIIFFRSFFVCDVQREW
jgi:hypothetical protein